MSDLLLPKISILIPVRNEEKTIRGCLERILTNGYPADHLEIWVIDGVSDDQTRAIVEDMQNKYAQIHLLENPKRVPYTALNIGLKASTGEIVMRVDARSFIPEHYIETLWETMVETSATNVGGLQVPITEGSVIKRAIALATVSIFGTGGAAFRTAKKSGFVDTVYLGFFRREIFDRVGLYDEDGEFISEDSMMNRRILNAGGKIYLNADLSVLYHGKDSFRELARQYLIYGAAKCHSFLTYKQLTSWRQMIPLAAIGAFNLNLILALFIPFFLCTLIIGLLIYLIVDFTASTYVAVKNQEIKLFPVLLFVFPVIHFSWPNGFFGYFLMRNKFGQILKRS